MKKKFLLIFIFINLIFIPKIFAQKISIIYIIENTPITNIEIKKEISYLLLINSSLREVDQNTLNEFAVRSVIREKIKEIELKKFFVFGKNENVVNDYINNLIRDLNLENKNQFNQLLEEINLDENFIKRKIEIELLWNNHIYKLYNEKININEELLKENLAEQINTQSNEIDEFLLYEIIFSGNNSAELKNKYNNIEKSINEIGFENTANIYSDAISSKTGGKIGWINENQLSNIILKNIKNLELGSYSKPINVSNGVMLLLVKDKRKISKIISMEEEFKKLVIKEKNDQLNQFSTIHYKKLELKTEINEN